jgi:hypothetical protein
MSALNDMLVSMIKGIIPPEVMAVITPEKANEVLSSINDFKTRFETVETTVKAIAEKLNVGSNDYNGGNASISDHTGQ